MTHGASDRARTILHLFQCTNLGGMEQVTFRLMDRLVDRGFSFRVATPRPFGLGRDRVLSFDPAARDFSYRGRFGWRDFPALRGHVRALAEECDGIWVTGTSAAALASIRGIRKPKILSHHYHHLEGAFARLRWRAFYELLCRDLDRVTYPSAFTRAEAIAIAPWLDDKACVVRNGIDVRYLDEPTHRARQAAARRELGLPQDAFIVGNAGWLIRRKRFDVFLQVAARLRSQVPNSQFVICGGGEEEAGLKRLAADLGLEQAVSFVGWVKDLAPHYQAWDALLFNTDFDTLPSTPMEAAAEGCVVVASQIYGGLEELVERGRTGYLFSRHDVDALAAALIDLRSHPGKADGFRRAAAAKLRAEFSLEAAADFFADFFTERSSPP